MVIRSIGLVVVLVAAFVLTSCTFAPTGLGILSLLADNKASPPKQVWTFEPSTPDSSASALPDLSATVQHAAVAPAR